jgi:Subtilase family/Proprotein convertase P-domain/Carboxypeptidase regulatory-like domain
VSQSPLPRRAWRLLGLLSAVLAVLGLAVSPAAASPATAQAASQAQPGKIEPTVANDLQAHGRADFFVRFTEHADLTAASRIKDWTRRGEAVVAALRQTADASQAAARQQLDAAHSRYQAFWISNTILVHGGTRALADGLTALPNVQKIHEVKTHQIPTPTPGQPEQTINAVEWGVAAIRANQVWSTFNVRGEAITVANIDSGVQFDHPALVGKYRGNTGGGTFDHNYDWFDPAHVCPSAAPCDNNDHGTHTMGTMVGDDGAGNQVGVAPGAKWIAAKGCETNNCSDASLLAAGQWILEPTDLNGANPRADLRPNIVNNSWGGPGNDAWYRDTVSSWRAAGIFPAFSNGNSGPACGTAGSPGDYPESYASGAFDINGAIASFSSRGASAFGLVKPNLAAPGVNVRSSVPGNTYAAFNGTSMASPHTAGTVALMWSAAPSLVGDIAQTSALLNQTAVDTNDTTCGGTATNNNVWGEGKLDALAAVTQSPRGQVGTLAGTVSNASTGAGIAGATVHIAGSVTRDLTTNATGGYSVTLPIGSYTATASAFGFATDSATVTVNQGATTTQNFPLAPASSHQLSGHVRDDGGNALVGATVTIGGTPIAPATTDATGAYSFASVPDGNYDVSASAGLCSTPRTQSLNLSADTTLDFTLPARGDTFGYTCVVEPSTYVQGSTRLALGGDDVSATVALPFGFRFYGTTYTQAFVSSNGNLNFLAASTEFGNTTIPSAATPNAAVYAFWDDLIVDPSSGVFTATSGTAPNRTFLVEWRDVSLFSSASFRVDAEAELRENGEIVLRYRNLDPAQSQELGGSATVGIENAAGTVALQYSANTASLSNAQSIRFRPPAAAPGCGPFTNGTDFAIPQNGTVNSPIVVSGCTGNASATSTAEVHIVHPSAKDLVVSLVAPDGTVYVLQNRTGGSNIDQRYTVNLSSEARNGTWNLRVSDEAQPKRTGRIDSWTLTL